MYKHFMRTVVAIALLAFALVHSKASTGRDISVGEPMSDDGAFDVEVGMLGNCTPTGQNCAFSMGGGCGGGAPCSPAYAGQPCAIQGGWPFYIYYPAECDGGERIHCVPDPTSFAQCCNWIDWCCEVTQRCTSAGACVCSETEPPMRVGERAACYTGPWGPGTSPPCAGP
jgi:hypothetical protein